MTRGNKPAMVLLALTCATAALAALCGGCGEKPKSATAQGETPSASVEASPNGELVVAIAGMITPKEGLSYYQALSEYVARKAGKRLRLIHKADYQTVNQMLEERKVDLAFVCSGPYVAAHEKFGLELMCAPVVKGGQIYYSYFIVPAASKAATLTDLKGKTFAFTDPESNTGKLVPTYVLGKMGTTPQKFFGKVLYTYSHDNSIKAVADGKADGAAVDSLIFEYTEAHNPQFTSRTRILSRSEPFAIPPVVVHPRMAPALKAALKEAFLGLDEDPSGRAILADMNIVRFDPIEDRAYDSIRAMEEWLAKHADK